MAKLFNRAKMTTATTGSGTITLGSAVTGFQTFADAGVANNDVIQYVIEEGSNFEIGTGTYTASGTTLTRTPSESSESDDSAITLSGQAKVSIVAIHADYNRLQYEGSTKAEASSTGVTVTGTLAATAVTGDGSGLTGIVSIPAGAILIWSGSTASIPSGWALCDGTNNTPDLRNRFVVGAGDTYSVDGTGGASTVTLTESQIPGHTHTVSAHTHSTPNHTHTFSGTTSTKSLTGTFQGRDDNSSYYSLGFKGTSGVFSRRNQYTKFINSVGAPYMTISGYCDFNGSHNHTYSGTTSSSGASTTGSGGGGNTGSTGSGSSHENLPPYYALAYIMKT